MCFGSNVCTFRRPRRHRRPVCRRSFRPQDRTDQIPWFRDREIEIDRDGGREREKEGRRRDREREGEREVCEQREVCDR